MIYAIGNPGAKPRLLLDVQNEEIALMQIADGEVAVTVPSVDTWVISDDGQSAEKYIKTFAELKADKWIDTKIIREQKIDVGCSVEGIGRFDTDAISRSNINGAVTTASIVGETYSVHWKLADNQIVQLGYDEIIQVGVTISKYVSDCHENSQRLWMLIEGATDIAALDAIDINSGWPE